MTQKELMLSGELYNASSDDSLYPDYVKARNILSKLNTMPFDDLSRKELINNLFGKIGKDCAIITPVYCDYGSNVYIGDRFFANYDCIFLDVCVFNTRMTSDGLSCGGMDINKCRWSVSDSADINSPPCSLHISEHSIFIKSPILSVVH